MKRQTVAALCPECTDERHDDCSHLTSVPVAGFPHEEQVALCTCICVTGGSTGGTA